MNNNLLHSISTIVVAFLVFVSSTGFSMNAHFCQNQLKGISFIGEVETCHDKQANTSCKKMKTACHHDEDASEAEKDGCCNNKQIVADSNDSDAITTQHAFLNNSQIDFVASFITAYIFNNTEKTNHHPVPQYRPPIPDIDIPVLYQAFLI